MNGGTAGGGGGRVAADFFGADVPTQAYVKACFMGEAGSGKSYTAAQFAAGLVGLLRERGIDAGGRPVAFLEAGENGFDFLRPIFRDAGVPVRPRKTRAFVDLIPAMEWAAEYAACLIVDSVTPLWQELCGTYAARKGRHRGLEFSDWAWLKREWWRAMDAFKDAAAHVILCGRAGYEYDIYEDEAGKKQIEKTGVKLKAEGETMYEPSLLVHLTAHQRETAAGPAGERVRESYVLGTVLKDRSDRIQGRAFENPTFADFAPHVQFLNLGGAQIIAPDADSSGIITDTGSGREAWREVEAVLDEIQSLIVRHVPGQAADDKRRKADLLMRHFGTYAWERVRGLRLGALKGGANNLFRELEGRDGYTPGGAPVIRPAVAPALPDPDPQPDVPVMPAPPDRVAPAAAPAAAPAPDPSLTPAEYVAAAVAAGNGNGAAAPGAVPALSAPPTVAKVTVGGAIVTVAEAGDLRRARDRRAGEAIAARLAGRDEPPAAAPAEPERRVVPADDAAPAEALTELAGPARDRARRLRADGKSVQTIAREVRAPVDAVREAVADVKQGSGVVPGAAADAGDPADDGPAAPTPADKAPVRVAGTESVAAAVPTVPAAAPRPRGTPGRPRKAAGGAAGPADPADAGGSTGTAPAADPGEPSGACPPLGGGPAPAPAAADDPDAFEPADDLERAAGVWAQFYSQSLAHCQANGVAPSVLAGAVQKALTAARMLTKPKSQIPPAWLQRFYRALRAGRVDLRTGEIR